MYMFVVQNWFVLYLSLIIRTKISKIRRCLIYHVLNIHNTYLYACWRLFLLVYGVPVLFFFNYFPLIVEVFLSVLVCSPEFFLDRLMTFEYWYTTVAFIYAYNSNGLKKTRTRRTFDKTRSRRTYSPADFVSNGRNEKKSFE